MQFNSLLSTIGSQLSLRISVEDALNDTDENWKMKIDTVEKIKGEFASHALLENYKFHGAIPSTL